MYTLDLAARNRFEAYGALDIETTGFDGAEDDLVAIGVGYYDGSGPPDDESRVPRTYAETSPLHELAIDTPGLTGIYTAEHLRQFLDGR